MKWHLSCTNLRCGWSLTATDRQTAERVRDDHQDRTGHDVAISPDRALSFVSADSLRDPSPAK